MAHVPSIMSLLKPWPNKLGFTATLPTGEIEVITKPNQSFFARFIPKGQSYPTLVSAAHHSIQAAIANMHAVQD